MKLSDRIGELPASGIRAMFTLAEKYDNTINLCFGEPGFATPQHIIDAGCDAWNSGYTKYVANPGIMPLRQAIAEKMNRVNGFSVEAENVIVNFGANQSLFSAMQVVLNPGDEILVPNPCFSNYFGYIALAGGVAVTVPALESDAFHVKAANLERYITPRTRAVIINTPCNPTGSVTPRADLEEIAELAIRHDLIVIADEPYESILFGDNEHYSIATYPGMFERTITVNSFSKTYAMTGWRIGYAVAPASVIKAMTLVQGSTTSNVTAAVQMAALTALKGEQTCVDEMNAEYLRSRDLLVTGLNQINGISCITPEGAFYAFANIRETGLTAKEMAVKLLDEVQVVTTPGDAFGPDGAGYLRFSFAASPAAIEEALTRMKRCLGVKGDNQASALN